MIADNLMIICLRILEVRTCIGSSRQAVTNLVRRWLVCVQVVRDDCISIVGVSWCIMLDERLRGCTASMAPKQWVAAILTSHVPRISALDLFYQHEAIFTFSVNGEQHKALVLSKLLVPLTAFYCSRIDVLNAVRFFRCLSQYIERIEELDLIL